jgi:microfibrillar-associated protein 1
MTQEKAAQIAEEAAKREEEEREQRKVDSKELAGETIRRELAESAWELSDQSSSLFHA